MPQYLDPTPSFKKMMNDVVDFGSCCECGTCVLVCPHNVIEYIDSKPKQTAKKTAAFDYCGISEGIGVTSARRYARG
jgi:Fe-S-cluster-containing hydrogenase component 2